MPDAAFSETSELVGDPARGQATTSLANLSTAISQHRPGLTVEQLAEGLLRPMLREWLDANLPDMVERLVQKEIQRMSDQAEPK
jgi:cell pole-organizing protein PopZ